MPLEIDLRGRRGENGGGDAKSFVWVRNRSLWASYAFLRLWGAIEADGGALCARMLKRVVGG